MKTYKVDSPNMIAAYVTTEAEALQIAFAEACRTQAPVTITDPDGETWTVYAE